MGNAQSTYRNRGHTASGIGRRVASTGRPYETRSPGGGWVGYRANPDAIEDEAE